MYAFVFRFTNKQRRKQRDTSKTTGSGLTANGLILDCQVLGNKIAF